MFPTKVRVRFKIRDRFRIRVSVRLRVRDRDRFRVKGKNTYFPYLRGGETASALYGSGGRHGASATCRLQPGHCRQMPEHYWEPRNPGTEPRKTIPKP